MELRDDGLDEFFSSVLPSLDERQRRMVAAAMAAALGRGGQAKVASASGLARKTIAAGRKELPGPPHLAAWVRRPGGGRKRTVDLDDGLLAALESLLEPGATGSATPPLMWTTRSLRALSAELGRGGHQASPSLVRRTLIDLGCEVGADDRSGRAGPLAADRQFAYVNDQVGGYLRDGQPVIALSCSRDEPTATDTAGASRVTVAQARDNVDVATLAVTMIGWWLDRLGDTQSAPLTRLMIVPDARSHLLRSGTFRGELAALAASRKVVISVCHLPSGVWRWAVTGLRVVTSVTMDSPTCRRNSSAPSSSPSPTQRASNLAAVAVVQVRQPPRPPFGVPAS
jgi:hypothetical protein